MLKQYLADYIKKVLLFQFKINNFTFDLDLNAMLNSY